MKKTFALLFSIAVLLAGCERYDHAIQDLNDRIEMLEGASIASVEQQIAAINSSLDDLEAADAALSDYTTTLETAAKTLEEELAATDAQIAALKSELQGEDAATKQALLDQLEALKSTIKADLEAINQEIAALKAKDTALEEQIASLKSYVDGQLAALEKEMGEGFATEAWAKASFATLAQYDSLQTVVSGIKASIEGLNTAIETLETRVNNKIATDIAAAVDSLGTALTGDYISKIGTAVSELTAAYTTAIGTAKSEMETAYIKAIGEAIATSEESMKAWVADTLAQDYYDIATIDALLGVLTAQVDSVDSALSDSIAVQKAALAAAKSELTAAYTEAIEEITKNDGIIDTRIAAAINAAKAELQGKIDAINTEINTIKNRLDALEDKVDALIARIQSIRFMPEYSDGKVAIYSDNSSVTLTFLLSPSAAAQAIASNPRVVTAYISRTQSITRAVDAPTAINVTKVEGTDKGMLTVTIDPVSLPTDYWATADEANLFIRISDGNNEVISEMIPACYTVICELPEGSTFRSAVHEQLADNTTAIKFIANSPVVTDKQIGTSPAYMQLNGTTLEIHTATKEFVFNANCTYMFSGETGYEKFAKLTAIDFNDCINTEKVTDMSYMFYYCSALTSLDLSKFNTEKVTNMTSMFNMCSALTSLNLSSFNTEIVTNMTIMFNCCYALTSLDLSQFNTANVTSMRSMFNRCEALTSLDIRNFDIGKVTTISSIFSYVGSQAGTGSKTPIKVTSALHTALKGKGVSPGSYAEYYVIDEQPM